MNKIDREFVRRKYENKVLTAEEVSTCPPHHKVASYNEKLHQVLWRCRKCNLLFNNKQELINANLED